MPSKKINPLISIIICTYNTKDMTLKCLDRVKKSIEYLKMPVETVVVENGSDGTVGILRKKYPWVKLVEPKANTGFAKGNNLGIKAANKNSKYLLLLNTDSFLEPETLKKAVDFVENNKECDVLGCRLNYGNGKLQPSAGNLPTPVSVWTWLWGLDLLPIVGKKLKSVHPKDKLFFKTSKKVGWVMGTFLFMKSEVIKKVGGFDEKIFMYMEEVELCKRIEDSGFTIWYTPSFEIIHLDKASSSHDPQKLAKIFSIEIKGIVYFLGKYYKKELYWLLPIIKIGLLTRTFLFFVLGNKARSGAYSEALKTI